MKAGMSTGWLIVLQMGTSLAGLTPCAKEGMDAFCMAVAQNGSACARKLHEKGCDTTRVVANFTTGSKGPVMACVSWPLQPNCSCLEYDYQLLWIRGCIDPSALPHPMSPAKCASKLGDCRRPPVRPPTPANHTVVFRERTEGYIIFRVPALLRMPSGALLLFAEGRRQLVDVGPNDIVLKRSWDQGATWGPLQRVFSQNITHPVNINSPTAVAVVSQPGRVVVLCARHNDRQVLQLESMDDGDTWGPAKQVAGQSYPTNTTVATGPPTGVQLSGGRLVEPIHLWGTTAESHHCNVLYSDDLGKTWHLSKPADGGDECQAAQLANGTLILNMRTPALLRKFSWSHDNGSTWSAPRLSDSFPDPYGGGGCEGSTVVLPGSGLLAFSTPLGPVNRANMTIFVSADGGATWALHTVVDPSWAAYSSLAAAGERSVHIAYEADQYGSIRFATYSLRNETGAKKRVVLQPVESMALQPNA